LSHANDKVRANLFSTSCPRRLPLPTYEARRSLYPSYQTFDCLDFVSFRCRRSLLAQRERAKGAYSLPLQVQILRTGPATNLKLDWLGVNHTYKYQKKRNNAIYNQACDGHPVRQLSKSKARRTRSTGALCFYLGNYLGVAQGERPAPTKSSARALVRSVRFLTISGTNLPVASCCGDASL